MSDSEILRQSPQPGKSLMSQTEASWHETQAGNRAKAAAEAEGASPDAVDAVLDAAAGPVTIGGFKLMPSTQGTLFTLQRLAKEFEAWKNTLAEPLESTGDADAPGEEEMLEIALSVLVFADARGVTQKLKSGKMAELITQAEKLVWEIPIEVSLELNKHFTFEMERVKKLSGGATDATPGKPTPATETSAGVSSVTLPEPGGMV